MIAKDRVKKFLLIEGFTRSQEDIFDKMLIGGYIRIRLYDKKFTVQLGLGVYTVYTDYIEYTQKTREICLRIKELCNFLKFFRFKNSY